MSEAPPVAAELRERLRKIAELAMPIGLDLGESGSPEELALLWYLGQICGIAARAREDLPPGGPLRVRLDEENFRDLVAGDVASLKTAQGEEVRVILADIGWGRMKKAILDAEMVDRRPKDPG